MPRLAGLQTGLREMHICRAAVSMADFDVHREHLPGISICTSSASARKLIALGELAVEALPC